MKRWIDISNCLNEPLNDSVKFYVTQALLKIENKLEHFHGKREHKKKSVLYKEKAFNRFSVNTT